jgi:hypothetical protein
MSVTYSQLHKLRLVRVVSGVSLLSLLPVTLLQLCKLRLVRAVSGASR